MIEQPYLLVMTLPVYVDGEGRRYLDELWHKDLVAHLVEIRDLTLAAPLRYGFPENKVLEIDHSTFEGKLHFLEFPECRSTLKTIASLPKISALLWKAIGKAKIVHSGAGGWPISFAWVAIPMAKLRGKFTLTVVESGGWRLGFKRPWKAKSLLQAIVFETMARMIVNISDMVAFTHCGYRDSMMLKIRRHRGHIVCASWIDRDTILSRDQAESTWQVKLADTSRPLRVVFAANLLLSKGVMVLLDALKELDRRGVAVHVDMYGQGPLLDQCAEASRALTKSVKLELRGLLAYGEPFFQMLLEPDVMVVPSLSDEQPRIIFDCFARALPVIASKTAGVLECVTDGLNGKLVLMGDVKELADAIEWASIHRDQLREFGINALDVAASLTHDQMHSKRADLIESAFNRVALSHA